MQATVARRIGLLVTLGGAALYLRFSGEPDHKPVVVASILTILGGMLFVILHSLRNVERNPLETRVTAEEGIPPTSVGIWVRLHQKVRTRRTLALLPHFSLLAALVLTLLLSFFMVFGPVPSKGLWVFLSQSFVTKARSEPAGPVVVFLRSPRKAKANLPTRILVNEREIDWRNLRGSLLSELSRRPDWVVFIDADPNLPYEDAVQVIDVVTQLSARPVLLSRRPTQREVPSGDHDGQYSPSQPAVVFRAISGRN